jgi:hypothetical protein
MIKITDPNLLAQLEAAPSSMKKVTDPALLAQLERQSIPQNNSNVGFLPARLGADILAGLAEGGQSLRNVPYNITRTIAPETAERIAQSGWAGRHLFAPQKNDFSSTFGVNEPNILDRIIQGTASVGPLAAATGGGTLAGLMRGGAISGGLTSENPFLGATLGAGAGAIGKAIPTIGKSLIGLSKRMGSTNPINWIRPGQTAQEIAYRATPEFLESNVAPSRALYNKAFEGTKGMGIYEPQANRIALNELTGSVSKEAIPDSAIKYRDIPAGKLKELIKQGSGKTYPEILPEELALTREAGGGGQLELMHDLFTEQPTLENAHNLQRQLGYKIGNLKGKIANKTISPAEEVILNRATRARDILKNDIHNFLERVEPGKAKPYKQATELFKNDVIPARNAADIINKHIHMPGNRVEAESLSNALKRASSLEGLERKPLPSELLNLNEILRKRIGNKEAAKVLGKYAAYASGLGWAGVHTLQHLMGHNK